MHAAEGKDGEGDACCFVIVDVVVITFVLPLPSLVVCRVGAVSFRKGASIGGATATPLPLALLPGLQGATASGT